MRFDIIRNGEHLETHYAEDSTGVDERVAAMNAKLDDGDAPFLVVAPASENKKGNPVDGKGATFEYVMPYHERPSVIAAKEEARAAELAAAEAAKAG
jgi:hypothetical protein